MDKKKRTRVAVSVAILVGILIWEVWDGVKEYHSLWGGFIAFVGGLFSIATTYWIVQVVLTGKSGDDDGPTVV